MVGGGCGGNQIFGGCGGKIAFYKINTENNIHIETIGKGGEVNEFGGETKISLDNNNNNNNKFLVVGGGNSYSKNEFGEKSNCSSGIIGGDGGNKNENGKNGFIFIKFFEL